MAGLAAPASAQVPNGGFESWVDHGTYMDPAGWLTYNDNVTSSGPVITVEQGFPGAVGAFYAKITTRELPIGSALQGWMSINGFAYAGRPEGLTGQWQYGIQPGDTGMVTVALTKWNSTFGTRDPIAFGTLEVTGDLAGWHPLYVPFTYYSEEVADTAYIQFEASINFADPVVGSFMKVDDLAFDGTVGVEEQPALPVVRMFPSPATTALHIVADQRVAEVDVQDITGRTVLKQSTNAESTVVDIANLNPGRYLVQLHMAEGKPVVRSFVKQ
jgi:hypothetical protein